MSDGEHVVLILKIYYLIQPRKRKISPKLNIHEESFRKGKIKDKKFYYFQLFKFISAVFCRGGQGPPVLKVVGAVAPLPHLLRRPWYVFYASMYVHM